MKWCFCVNEEALPKYLAEIELAVHSCIANTSLEPHLVFDGKSGPFTNHLADLDVQVHFSRTPLTDDIAAIPEKPGYRHVNARGTFLRFEIANLFDDEFVLYTDCDVMFRKEFDLDTRPAYLSAGPAEAADDWRSFNSGVMVLNVPNLKRDYHPLIDRSRALLGSPVIVHAYDQGVLNEFYEGRWTRLPPEYNWRPYWGTNANAAIVHLHGPKLAVIRQLLGMGGNNMVWDAWQRLFDMQPDSYRNLIEEAEQILRGSIPSHRGS